MGSHISLRGFLANPYTKPPLLLQFQWNPSRLSEQKTVKYNDIEMGGLMAPVSVYSSGGNLTYRFELLFDTTPDSRDLNYFSVESLGLGVHAQVQTLMSWVYPETKDIFNLSNVGSGEPPACYFGLGIRVLRGKIRVVDVQYELFEHKLIPQRARATVEFVADESGTWGKVNTIFRRMASSINLGGQV